MAAAITLLPTFVLALLGPTLGDLVPGQALTDDSYEGAFETWRHRYHKSYATPEDQEVHFAAFKKNYDIVKTTNAQGGSFTVELNIFGDIASKDFALTHGSTVDRNSSRWGEMPMLGVHRMSDVSLPSSVDWHAKGMVTAVKNQGQCGGCWAFTTTGSIESAWAIATNGTQLLSLSEQQLVDCDTHYDTGCGGGLPENSFTYLEKAPMCTEGTYKFTSGLTKARGKCQVENCVVAIVQGGIIGFKVVTSPDTGFSVDSLMSAVAQQPVTASVAGDDPIFMLYAGGVMHDKDGRVCSDQIDHSVLLVGYGKQGSLDYWLIKNSWGSTWGESGYGKVLRGKPSSETGECGIRTDSAYPTVDVSKANPWMNGLPLGTILACVLGGIALLMGVCFCGMTCIWKRRRTQQGTGIARAPNATPARRLVTPIAVQASPVQAVQAASVEDPFVRKGNSGASRLLG